MGRSCSSQNSSLGAATGAGAGGAGAGAGAGGAGAGAGGAGAGAGVNCEQVFLLWPAILQMEQTILASSFVFNNFLSCSG